MKIKKFNEEYEPNGVEVMPTAEEFSKSKGILKSSLLSVKGDYSNFDAMIDFAKLHVEAALKAAYENANIIEVKKVAAYDYADSSNYGVDKKSIISAYPLTNIK